MSGNLVVSTGAATSVPNHITNFRSTAGTAITEARDALASMHLNPIASRPSAPGQASISVEYITPGSEPISPGAFSSPTWRNTPLNLDAIDSFTPASFTGNAPPEVTPSIPTKPLPSSIPDPGIAPVVDSVALPDVPVLPIIKEPLQWAISIPPAPTIIIPPFTAVKPTPSGISKPSGQFSWSESPYSSGLLDATVVQIKEFMAGGVGIPDSVWEAIWAKDNDRENRAGIKQITEINEEWSNRGFQLPQGVQVAQIQEVYQELQHSSAGRSRDIAVREADLAIENLRFAVQQGIAMETLRGQWYQQSLSRELEGAMFASKLSIDLFNAELAMFNAEVQMYIAEGQIYKVQIDAILAELEVYKAELEGQQIIGQLNQQQVEIYKTRIDAANLLLEQYVAELQGAKIATEIQMIEIDAYKATVMAFGERIKAVSLEYEAYNTQMQGAKIEAEIYGESVDAFSATVNAYATEIDAEAKTTEMQIRVNELKIKEFDALLGAYTTELNSAVETVKANAAVFDSEVSLFNSKINDASNHMQKDVQVNNANLTNAQYKTQAAIASAEQSATHSVSSAKMVNEAVGMIAKINGSYASSALSAVNLGESIRDSATNSASA